MGFAQHAGERGSGCLVPAWLGPVASKMPLSDVARDALCIFPFLPQSLTVNWENIILPTPLLLSPDRRSLCPPASMSRAAAPRAQCCAVPAVCPPRAQWDYALSAGTRGAVLSACCRRMIFLFSVCLQPFVPGLS